MTKKLRLIHFIQLAALALMLVHAGAAMAQDHDCVVRQFILTNMVTNLEPQGIVEGNYPKGTERAYGFARLDCTQVRSGETFWFYWIRNDQEVGRSKARVDVSRNWRIWSQSRIFPGEWVLQLKDSDGRLQAERRFSVAELPKPSDN